MPTVEVTAKQSLSIDRILQSRERVNPGFHFAYSGNPVFDPGNPVFRW
jgi:hypothetical protein